MSNTGQPIVSYTIQSPAAAARALRRHRIKAGIVGAAFVGALVAPSPWALMETSHHTTQVVLHASTVKH